MNKSRNTCDWAMSPVRKSHVKWWESWIHVMWLIHMCDMTCSHVTWSVHLWHAVFHSVNTDVAARINDRMVVIYTCIIEWYRMVVIYTCIIAHSYVWHDLFTRVGITPSERERDMTHSCGCRDSFACVLWLIHMGHSYASFDSFTPVTYLEIICGHN